MSGCDRCAGEIDLNELEEPQALIARLRAGDIFHATQGSRSHICLALSIDEIQINAWCIPKQIMMVFDRRTGVLSEPSGEADLGKIDCVEPLPMDIHDIFLRLERRYRLGRSFNRFKLSDDEKNAFKFANDHFDQNRFETIQTVLGEQDNEHS